MSIAVKSGLPSLGSTEGAVITKDDISVTEETSPSASAGEDLPRGKSAYEVAVENGFSGTETEWLASLKGATGAPGADGKDGTDGKTPYVGDNGNWYIGADDTGKPSRGAKGDKGDTGAQGIQGVQGEKGDKGDKGSPGAKGDKGEPGAKGDKGDPGATPNLTIGTVTTLDAGQNATASMGGTAESPVLNLGIPRGAKGEPGQGGGGTYYVELDGNYPDLTLSETTPLADIAAAYNEGKALFCRLSTAHHTVSLPLFMSLTELNIWIFGGSGGTAAIYMPAEYATIVVGEQGVTVEDNGLVLTNSIVTSVSAESTDSEVPSAKCLYDELQERSLKQATSDTLGGVKADPATADDTQPVRIGNDGKLVTAAGSGGTDISLGLTSASVGQIVKVKAVDESGKPTAWEALDRTWKVAETYLLKDMTFPAAISIPQGKDSLLMLSGTDITPDKGTNVNITMKTAVEQSGYGSRWGFTQKMHAHSWGCGMFLELNYIRDGTARFWMRQTGWEGDVHRNQIVEDKPTGETNRFFYILSVDNAENINKNTTANIILYTRDAL